MRLILAAVLGIAGCAPEPTTPADTNLAGTWVAPRSELFFLSAIKFQIIQEPKGIVSGQWFARSRTGEGCVTAPPCDATGNVIGRNTVSQVEIDLIGAGKFEGQFEQNSQLRGIFAVKDGYDTITFNRGLTPVASRGSQ